MKNWLNIIYEELPYICPCGQENGCQTVSEMNNCDNLDSEPVSNNELTVSLIIPSRMNYDKNIEDYVE